MSAACLKANLKELKLPVMASVYKKEALAAQTMDMGYEEFLLRLSDLELTEKRQVRINRLLRQFWMAGLSDVKRMCLYLVIPEVVRLICSVGSVKN